MPAKLSTRQRICRHFDRAAADYDAHAVLQQTVEQRLLERLDLIRLQPDTLLDLGCGTGKGSAALRARYPQAPVISLDLSHPMARRTQRRLIASSGALTRLTAPWLNRPSPPCLCADMAALPLADNSIDLVFSNLTLQWSQDLPATLAHCLAVLRPGGLLLFTTLGPDTLNELRQAWQTVDDRSHVNTFIDLHDIGDMLMHGGFAEPVMDREPLTLTYRDAHDVLNDLRGIGADTVLDNHRRGLTSPAKLRAMLRAYNAMRHNDRVQASYDILYGHAWKPLAPPGKRAVAFR